MLHPFLARRMNNQFSRRDLAPLSPDEIDYAQTAVQGLHVALSEQVKPVYRRPKHPVDGWGLTHTPLCDSGEILGIPIVNILGSRAIYLSMTPGKMQRVLTAPDAHTFGAERVIQIKNTSVPDLLEEDPSLYYGLLAAVDESIQVFGLEYQVAPLPIIPIR